MKTFNVFVTMIRAVGQSQKWIRVDADNAATAAKLAQNIGKASSPVIVKAITTIVRLIK